MEIRLDDLTGIKIVQLIGDHLQGMGQHSPPESIHALNLEQLKNPAITFWSAWEDNELLGCGALKELNGEHGEIKSMKTAPAHLRIGVAKQILQHIIDEAKKRGYQHLSLETGSTEAFEAARQLYVNFGFKNCPPFADYIKDPHSVFMTKEIERA